MAADPFLVRNKAKTWTNFHGTVTVKVRASWTVMNSSSEPKMSVMRETAGRLQGLIRAALKEGVRLRTVGSRWSFSQVAAAEDGWAVGTDNLNLTFAIGSGSLDPAYTGTSEELFLAQCGASLAEIRPQARGARAPPRVPHPGGEQRPDHRRRARHRHPRLGDRRRRVSKARSPASSCSPPAGTSGWSGPAIRCSTRISPPAWARSWSATNNCSGRPWSASACLASSTPF